MSETCIICHETLRLSDPDDEEVIYDDVELICSHHLHYECARELHAQSKHPITKCPECSANLLTGSQLLVTIRNEGGQTPSFDLGADLEDQRELSQNPELARNEALLSFCFSGDYSAIEDVIKDGAKVDARQRETGWTGLHLCALNNDSKGIKLLLSHHADRTISASNGGTALDIAVAEGSHEAAYALQS